MCWLQTGHDIVKESGSEYLFHFRENISKFTARAGLQQNNSLTSLTPLCSSFEFVEELLFLQFLHQAQINEVLRFGLGLLELV
jgi:hypothetical protein